MKFNIGDKIKVVKIGIPSDITNTNPDLYINEIGVITNIDPHYRYPYVVKFDNNILDELGNEFWGEYELEYASEKDMPLLVKLNELIEQLKYENQQQTTAWHQLDDSYRLTMLKKEIQVTNGIIERLEELLGESNSK
jgi:hypothetical protein